MSPKILLPVIFLFGVSSLSINAQTTFRRHVDGTSLNCLMQTTSGDIYVGATWSTAPLLRFSGAGALLGATTRSRDSLVSRHVADLEAAPDGGWWVLADVCRLHNARRTMVLYRFNPAGVLLWQTPVMEGVADVAWFNHQIQVDAAGNVLALTSAVFFDPQLPIDQHAFMVTRINTAGTVAWRKTFHLANQYIAPFQLLIRPDGTLIVLGAHFNENRGFSLHLDADGDQLEATAYPDLPLCAGVNLPGGDYLICGDRNDRPGIIRLDPDGDMIWSRQLAVYQTSGSTIHAKLFAGPNGRILYGGLPYYASSTQPDLLAFSPHDGSVQWARRYQLCRSEGMQDLIRTTDGGLAGVQLTNHTLLKLDAEGQSDACETFSVAVADSALFVTQEPFSISTIPWPEPEPAPVDWWPTTPAIDSDCPVVFELTGLIRSADTLCQGDTLNAEATANDFFTAATWTFAGGTPDTVSESLTASAALTGAGQVTIAVMASQGICERTLSASVYVRPRPEAIDLGPDTAICDPSGPLVLDATAAGAAAYMWNDGFSDPVRTVTTSGSYAVLVTADGGCTRRDTVVIVLAHTPVIDLGPDTLLCGLNGYALDVSQAQAQLYAWPDGFADPVRVVEHAGLYTVTAYNGPCAAADTVAIDFFPAPPALPVDTALCAGEPLQLPAGVSGAGLLWWNDEPASGDFIVADSGLVRRRVAFAHCRFEDSVRVARFDCQSMFQFYAPNAFNPDGAEANRRFRIFGGDEVEVLELMIFDRWGSLVYHGHGDAAAWDGTARGRPAAVGQYVWAARLKRRDEVQWAKGGVLKAGAGN